MISLSKIFTYLIWLFPVECGARAVFGALVQKSKQMYYMKNKPVKVSKWAVSR